MPDAVIEGVAEERLREIARGDADRPF